MAARHILIKLTQDHGHDRKGAYRSRSQQLTRTQNNHAGGGGFENVRTP